MKLLETVTGIFFFILSFIFSLVAFSEPIKSSDAHLSLTSAIVIILLFAGLFYLIEGMPKEEDEKEDDEVQKTEKNP